MNESRSEMSFSEYNGNDELINSNDESNCENYSKILPDYLENEDDATNAENDTDTKSNIIMRLDLMNEIKDEILDEASRLDSQSTNYSHLNEDEEDEENEMQQDDIDVENLNNLKICIDEIEEVVDKSNKPCYVFLIQVWNIQFEANNDLEPNWQVKRKYDEFYVLDNKLKEFHGDELNVELPAKKGNIFSSTSRNLEYLNSVKNDFAKYVQVNNLKENRFHYCFLIF